MTMQAYSLPGHVLLRREITRKFFRALFFLLCRVQMTGQENIPQDEPYLIVYNHVSLFEPPLMLSFWPSAPEAISAIDVARRPGQNVLAWLYHVIYVDRGGFNRHSIDQLVAALRSGRPLLMAPEGRRSHEPGLQDARPGVAFLAAQTKAPILPVGIVGTTEDMLRRSLKLQRPLVEIRIGKLLRLDPQPEPGESRKVFHRRNADLVMKRIAELLPAEYRGMYG